MDFRHLFVCELQAVAGYHQCRRHGHWSRGIPGHALSCTLQPPVALQPRWSSPNPPHLNTYTKSVNNRIMGNGVGHASIHCCNNNNNKNYISVKYFNHKCFSLKEEWARFKFWQKHVKRLTNRGRPTHHSTAEGVLFVHASCCPPSCYELH